MTEPVKPKFNVFFFSQGGFHQPVTVLTRNKLTGMHWSKHSVQLALTG